MKNLDEFDSNQVLEDLTFMLIEEFDEQRLSAKKAKQLLLNILADNEIGCAIRRKAKEYIEASPEWEIAAVEPTPDPERVLITIQCPECREEYWYKVRVHRPDEIRNRAPKECPGCGMKLQHPRMIAF